MASGFAAFGAGFFGGLNKLNQQNHDDDEKWIERYDSQLTQARQMLMARNEKLADHDARVAAYTSITGDKNKALALANAGAGFQDVIDQQQAEALSPPQPAAPKAPAATVAPTVPGVQPVSPAPSQPAAPPNDQQPTAPSTPVATAASSQVASNGPGPIPAPPQPQAPAMPNMGQQAPDQQPPNTASTLSTLLTGHHTPDQVLGRAQAREQAATGMTPEQQQNLMAGNLPKPEMNDPTQTFQFQGGIKDMRKGLIQAFERGDVTDPVAFQDALAKGDYRTASSYVVGFHERADEKVKQAQVRNSQAINEAVRTIADLETKQEMGETLTSDQQRQLIAARKVRDGLTQYHTSTNPVAQMLNQSGGASSQALPDRQGGIKEPAVRPPNVPKDAQWDGNRGAWVKFENGRNAIYSPPK